MEPGEIIGLIIFLCILMFPVMLLVGSYMLGSYIDKKHMQEIRDKEKLYSSILVSDIRAFPQNWDIENAQFVSGSVVIGNDYFKRFLIGWIKFFGGELRCCNILYERARREATVRMLEQAAMNGANAIWGVRYTSTAMEPSQGGDKKQAGCVEIVAYGTAIRVNGKY